MEFTGLSLPAGLHLRPSTNSDGPFLEALSRTLMADLDLADASADYIEAVKEQQFYAQTEGYGEQFPNAMYFIIEYHHEKVGKLTLDFGHNEIRIVDLGIIKKARGKGLGKGVLQALIACSEQTLLPLYLTVLSHNIVAKALYISLGFNLESAHLPYEQMVYLPSSQRTMVGI